MSNYEYLKDIWTLKDGIKLYPYKVTKGSKKGLYSVNFTNDTKNFVGLTENELRKAIEDGRFRDRGTIRMLPLEVKSAAVRSAYAPQFYKQKAVKDY